MSVEATPTYSIGHEESALLYMRFRSAERCCGFFRDRVTTDCELLDCGCGPGAITMGLAAWASHGRVVGVDIGEAQLKAARRSAAERGIGNVEFRQASVFELPFPDKSFDVVFSQAMFCHIPNHAVALAEIHRVLKPGGWVAIRDVINGSLIVWPSDDLVRELQRIFRLGMQHSGGHPDVGMELGTMLDTAGFDDVFFSIDVEQPESTEERTSYFKLLADVVDGDLGALAVREGWIDPKRLRDVTQAFRGLATIPGSISCLPFGCATGRKRL